MEILISSNLIVSDNRFFLSSYRSLGSIKCSHWLIRIILILHQYPPKFSWHFELYECRGLTRVLHFRKSFQSLQFVFYLYKSNLTMSNHSWWISKGGSCWSRWQFPQKSIWHLRHRHHDTCASRSMVAGWSMIWFCWHSPCRYVMIALWHVLQKQTS